MLCRRVVQSTTSSSALSLPSTGGFILEGDCDSHQDELDKLATYRGGSLDRQDKFSPTANERILFMKKYISKFQIILLCILLFFCITIWKGTILYQKYPNPQIETYDYQETVQVGNYKICFDGWEWGNENLIQKDFPDYEFIYKQDEKTTDVRVGLIHFTITKNSQIPDASSSNSIYNDYFDISDIGFSSGTWRNAFDMELFYQLNPQLKSMVLDLKENEVQEVTLPLILLELQFNTKQWAEIDKRLFYINLQYYPKHIQFICPHLKS